MSENLVNLNVNPCKMCMPMGAVTALYGIKKCMSILHGSQGCSTYIRRHMATHYNEPVDIASSSLTEEGTVYGGEDNLIKGLVNLINLYQPQVIGVPTTCLAETIGEDIKRIIHKFYEKYPEHKDIVIIPVPSAGYAGTQYEGFFQAINQIIRTVEMDPSHNNRINVITGMLSPADTRYLKNLLEDFELDYILLPDLSENLDGVHREVYDRLPQGGTDISDIRQMAGAAFTIEISAFLEEDESPARYLNERYGVPYERVNAPIGLRDTDTFLNLLSRLSGKPIPQRILSERGRYLDAMIDNHKYNGEGRAAIYGEPDFIFSAVRLCEENGVMPILCATGSVCKSLQGKIEDGIRKVAKSYFIDSYRILDDTDFKTIEREAVALGANLL
ncbi:MAG TPA: nitrogenase component 1, partial [Lachnospiraceae bacterium]|nr:nitrogenase component 1 [Lachnospiraceae bacterium]